MKLQSSSKNGFKVACDSGAKQQNLVVLWFFFSLRKDKESTFIIVACSELSSSPWP